MDRSAPAAVASAPVAPDLVLLGALLRHAAGRAPGEALPDVLAALCDAGLRGAGVWLPDAAGRPASRWTAGALADDEARAAYEERAAAGEALALPLAGPDGAFGALVLAPVPPEPDAWDPVRDLVATLAWQALRDDLAGESALAGAADERRLVEGVVDALPVGVYVVDREYRVQLWNRKREVGTQGVTREEAIGRRIFDVLPRQDAALMRREFDEVLATGVPQQLTIESRSTGEPRTYRLTKLPMRLGGTEPTHVVTVGEDVTEWKAAVERTAQAEKLAAIGQLAAGVMHEINNPLATIAACAETMTLALTEVPRERQLPGFGEYLRIVDHEVQRCRRITDSLLGFSRAHPVERSAIGLNAVVERTLLLLKHHSRFKRCPIRLDLMEGAGPTIVCDADQLVQVTMALLLNAADAVAERPQVEDELPPGVTIRTAVVEGRAVLEVADEGVGIPREALSKIFEPFYTTKPVGQGTGLGLAICYGILRDHGGHVEVESEMGVGSTFRVVLPAAVAGVAAGVT